MDFQQIYIDGLPYAIIGCLVYHYICIIVFLCWVVTQEKIDCIKFKMPLGIPCTMIASVQSRDDWATTVLGNIFLTSCVLVFLCLIWPVMLFIGIPIWLVASTRRRLYKGEQ